LLGTVLIAKAAPEDPLFTSEGEAQGESEPGKQPQAMLAAWTGLLLVVVAPQVAEPPSGVEQAPELEQVAAGAGEAGATPADHIQGGDIQLAPQPVASGVALPTGDAPATPPPQLTARATATPQQADSTELKRQIAQAFPVPAENHRVETPKQAFTNTELAFAARLKDRSSSEARQELLASLSALEPRGPGNPDGLLRRQEPLASLSALEPRAPGNPDALLRPQEPLASLSALEPRAQNVEPVAAEPAPLEEVASQKTAAGPPPRASVSETPETQQPQRPDSAPQLRMPAQEAKSEAPGKPPRDAVAERPAKQGEDDPARGLRPAKQGEDDPARELRPAKQGEDDPARELRPAKQGEDDPARELRPAKRGEDDPARGLRPAPSFKLDSAADRTAAEPVLLRGASLPHNPVASEAGTPPVRTAETPAATHAVRDLRTLWSGPAETPSPAATKAGSATLHELTLVVPGRVADGRQQGGVEVRVVERAGEVKVAVHTRDTELATTLRERLPDLVQRLERTGYHTETWRPADTRLDAARPQDLSGQRDGANAGQQRDQEQGRQEAHQQRRRRQEEPHWAQMLASAGLSTIPEGSHTSEERLT